MSISYVKRLRMVNWRSFSDWTLDFDPGVNTLVGPNNAGKSTILEAINLAIGDVYHNRYTSPTTDFYMGARDTFEVCLEISVPNTVLDKKSKWFYEKFFSQQDNSIQSNLIGSLRIVGHLNKGLEVSFLDRGGEWWECSTYHLGRAIDFVYARSVRDISRHTATSFRSPFSEIRRILVKRLDPATVKRVQERLQEADQELMKDSTFVELQNLVEEIIKDQTDLQRVGFSLTHPTPSELLRNLSILGFDTFESALETKGVGTQNAIILSLFQVLAMLSDKYSIFAFEEPEIGFHPHGQRLLVGRFQQLAERGNQVFITTHSPNLVDSKSLPNLYRVTKEGKVSRCYRMPRRPDLLKSLDKHMTGGTPEMVFASKVLVVEGPSEVSYYPAVSKLFTMEKEGRNMDFDRCNISVVVANGLSQVAKLMKITRELNIPCYCVADRSKDVKTQLFRHLLEEDLIKQEDFNKIPERLSQEWVKANEEFLLQLKCFLTEDEGFEGTILSSSSLLPRILAAVNTVRVDWGKTPLGMDTISQRKLLMDELRGHKGRRMGYELAKIYENSSELPSFVRRVIITLTADTIT